MRSAMIVQENKSMTGQNNRSKTTEANKRSNTTKSWYIPIMTAGPAASRLCSLQLNVRLSRDKSCRHILASLSVITDFLHKTVSIALFTNQRVSTVKALSCKHCLFVIYMSSPCQMCWMCVRCVICDMIGMSHLICHVLCHSFSKTQNKRKLKL